jgi:hypothetical protein
MTIRYGFTAADSFLMKYDDTFIDEERAKISKKLKSTFFEMARIANDEADDYAEEARAATNSAKIVSTLIRMDAILPDDHQKITKKLKKLFKLHAARATEGELDDDDCIHSAGASHDIANALLDLEEYAKQKNRFGTFKPIT